jgi:hypothetical protein
MRPDLAPINNHGVGADPGSIANDNTLSRAWLLVDRNVDTRNAMVEAIDCGHSGNTDP